MNVFTLIYMILFFSLVFFLNKYRTSSKLISVRRYGIADFMSNIDLRNEKPCVYALFSKALFFNIYLKY